MTSTSTPQGLTRQFAWLWVSNLFFFGASWMITIILGWLIYEVTASPLLLSVFTFCRTVPMLLGPVAGVIADRVHRVRFLVTMASWATVVVAFTAIMVTLDRTPVWLILAAGLGVGLAHSPTQPARTALVIEYVGPTSVSRANAINSLAISLTQVLGPTVGSILITTIEVSGALWAAAACFALATLALIPLRHTGRSRHATRKISVLHQLHEGVRTVLRIRPAVGILVVTILANFLLWPVYQSFVPVFAVDQLHLGANGMALLLTCCGTGSLLGSLFIARLGDFRHKGRFFLYGTVLWALGWLVFTQLSGPAAAGVALFLAGIASSGFMVLQATVLLIAVPREAHGQSLGLMQLAIGAQPFGAVVIGVVSEHIGVPNAVALSTAILAVGTVLVAVAVPQLRRFR